MSEFDDTDWSDGVTIREPWFPPNVEEKTKYEELPGLFVCNMDGLEEIATFELINFHELDTMRSEVLVEREDVPELIEVLEAWYDATEGKHECEQ